MARELMGELFLLFRRYKKFVLEGEVGVRIVGNLAFLVGE